MTIIKRTILDRRFPGKRKHADLQFGWPDAAPGPAPDVQVVGNGVVIQDGA